MHVTARDRKTTGESRRWSERKDKGISKKKSGTGKVNVSRSMHRQHDHSDATLHSRPWHGCHGCVTVSHYSLSSKHSLHPRPWHRCLSLGVTRLQLPGRRFQMKLKCLAVHRQRLQLRRPPFTDFSANVRHVCSWCRMSPRVLNVEKVLMSGSLLHYHLTLQQPWIWASGLLPGT